MYIYNYVSIYAIKNAKTNLLINLKLVNKFTNKFEIKCNVWSHFYRVQTNSISTGKNVFVYLCSSIICIVI